ncbi:MAG: hypothetical protein NC200_06030 [Candidatus Gastranaerophilales bacterium]|nr:hypothetical protein [Candidatus Gastranaerophilales bacterium]
MSEVENKNRYIFNFTERKAQLKKSDFKEKSEKNIYEFFHQNSNGKDFIPQGDFYNSFKMFDFGDDSTNVITEEEITKFLQQAKSQDSIMIGSVKFKTKMLKNITEEDFLRFFEKVTQLNPTSLEKIKTSLASGLKNENGENVFTDEILSNFQSEKDSININDFIDSENNIKSGYELFDLNGDGKLDDFEKSFLYSNYNINGLTVLSNKFDELGEKDGIVTSDEKLAAYNRLREQHYSRVLSDIDITSLKDSRSGDDMLTPEVRALFSQERTEISMDNLVDENGFIKKGYELFDLNGDKKLDDLERNYFSTGGKYINKGSNIITVENFAKILSQLDVFDGRHDEILTQNDRRTLYLYIQGAHQMLNSLEEFPEEIRSLYEQALVGISHLEIDKNPESAGFQRNGVIGIKDENNQRTGKPDKFQVASVLIHELTHFICGHLSEDKKYPAITQEVQTFYMEHKLYDKMKSSPEFRFSQLKTDRAFYYLREENPEITELDIAKAVFMEEHFDWYNNHYQNKDPNIIQNAEYRPIGEIFNEPDNKADIYNAGIQKAFSGLTLLDENGKELITDELKSAFSANKPILSVRDFVDEKGHIKSGFEIFDLDGDGFLNGNERDYFNYITYNDLPKIVKILKEFNSSENNSKDSFVSAEVRRQFEEDVLHNCDMRRRYNFHNIK